MALVIAVSIVAIASVGAEQRLMRLKSGSHDGRYIYSWESREDFWRLRVDESYELMIKPWKLWLRGGEYDRSSQGWSEIRGTYATVDTRRALLQRGGRGNTEDKELRASEGKREIVAQL
ncbi:hypothetical protein V3481_015398 [Fusarium oxysporum f. sp. vasinfectum]